MKPQTNSW